MKLSIFTTATSPVKRGDLVGPALQCYRELADEIIIIDGTYPGDGKWHENYFWDDEKERYDPKLKWTRYEWPKEFNWTFIGNQFQRGYEAATGDWVIHCDLDFLFHEKDYAAIRKACEENSNAPALSFYKHQFVLPDRFNLKSRLVIAVNKAKYGERIRFDSGGDLCQPSLDGKELRVEDVPEAKIVLWNYEKMLKTKDQVRDDVGRMARAWQQHWGDYKLGGPDDESAYQEWLKMQIGRFQKPQEHIPLWAHPAIMRDVIYDLKPHQWGYNGFGSLGANDYVRRRELA